MSAMGDRKAIRTRLNFLYALESISVCFSVNMMSVNYFSSESLTLFFFLKTWLALLRSNGFCKYHSPFVALSAVINK